MTDISQYSQPFRCRPLIGKLKFVLAKVQSKFDKLPKDWKSPKRRLHMLNEELELYHLRAYDWAEFVNFVHSCLIDTKILSKLLRHARRIDKRYDNAKKWAAGMMPDCPIEDRNLNFDTRWTFSVEEILCAYANRVPFRLLRLEYQFFRDMDVDDIGYDAVMIQRRQRFVERIKSIQAQGDLIEFAEKRGLKIPLR